jgi:hypothetical protein
MLESGMPVFATSAGGVPDLQPFFQEKLRAFPPPLELNADILTSSIFPENYYQLFSWESIAETYANSIFLPFNSHKIET